MRWWWLERKMVTEFFSQVQFPMFPGGQKNQITP
jgi:hypothetical protein